MAQLKLALRIRGVSAALSVDREDWDQDDLVDLVAATVSALNEALKAQEDHGWLRQLWARWFGKGQ